MKILDIPQSGKRGLTVSQSTPFGQMSRTLAIPANPRTQSQMTIRDNLARVAARWRALDETERIAWMEAATEAKSNPRLGQSGSLSGFQLFTKINCTLSQLGQDEVDLPTERPQFPALSPQGLVITKTAGVVALKLTCLGDPGENTVIRAGRAVSQGREKWNDFRIIRPCPAAGAGSADITALYPARFGPPTVAKKVFVQASQVLDGWETLPIT